MKLLSPQKVLSSFPLTEQQRLEIASFRASIAECLCGEDLRLVVVTGPCSLHHQGSALEYAHRLKELQKKVGSHILLVMRAYVEKPRTTLGWKGALYHPPGEQKGNIEQGILWTRETLAQLAATSVPLATEFLEPLATPYIADLISLGFIGSRTTTSQIHRQLASSLPMPIGFKNTPDGSILRSVQALIAARASHTFMHIDSEGSLVQITSTGNNHTYLTLRGADTTPNYDAASLQKALRTLHAHNLPAHLLIDCSHGNSDKDPQKQLRTLDSLTKSILAQPSAIRAIMLESHLSGGAQPFSSAPLPDQSLTDPCLSWEETETALMTLHQHVSNRPTIAASTSDTPHHSQ